MSRLLLATNAGTDTRILHTAALRRADSIGSGLSVVHVLTGADYLAQPEELQKAVQAETEWLLHTMMALAADRAGVGDVDVTIHLREGDVGEQIVEFASSTRPNAVLLGEATQPTAGDLAGAAYEELIGRLERTGVRVERISD